MKQIFLLFGISLFSFLLNAQTITIPLSEGGAFGGGTILSVNSDDGSYSVTPFEGKTETVEEGISNPDLIPNANSGIFWEQSNNSLYIIAKKGARLVGENKPHGVIFKYNINLGKTTLIKQMSDDEMGAVPFGSLNKIGSKLYGVTGFGGEFGFGVIFSIDISNNDKYEVVFSFDGGADGGNPTCQLFAEGSILYGAGRTINGDNTAEVYFTYDVSTGTYSVLYGSPDGAAEHNVSGMFKRNNFLYFSRLKGIYRMDLNNPSAGYITYFTGITPDDVLGSIAGDFTLADGKWYTIFKEGGSLGYGTIGRMTFQGDKIENIHNFQGEGAQFGQAPTTKVVAGVNQNEIYGTALNQNDDYILYKRGITDVNPTPYVVVHSFSSQDDGLFITASPVMDNYGKVWGISERYGEYNSGTIWSYDFINNTFQVETQLGFVNGKTPLNGFSPNPSTNEYGFVTYQGNSAKGNINSFNRNAHTQTLSTKITEPDIAQVYYKPIYHNSKTYLLVDFSQGAIDTYFSFAGLVELDVTTGLKVGMPIPIEPTGDATERIGTILQGNIIYDNDFLYGISSQYLWKIDLNTLSYIRLHKFTTASEGNIPQSIILKGDTLFGLNSQGGGNGTGTVFKYNLANSTFTVISNIAAHESCNSLVFQDNKLYSVISNGATSSIAVLDLNASSPSFSNIVNMDPNSIGYNPGPFLCEMDSVIYGALNSGAANNLGSLYKFEIPTNTLTKIIDFNNTTGHLSYNSEILVDNNPLSVPLTNWALIIGILLIVGYIVIRQTTIF